MLGSSSIVANIIIRAQNLTQREFAQVTDDMRGVEAQASTFGQRFGAAANGVGSFMTRLGLVGGALGLFATVSAAHFQDAGQQVKAFSNISQQQLQKTEQSAMRLSNTFGVGATAIVKSSRDIYNTGVGQYYPAMQVMAAGTKLAASQHAELGKVMMALDTTLKDYPHGFKNAADAAGEFAAQARISRGTIDEISRALSITEPMASKLGFRFSDLASVVDQLVRHGNSLQESNQMVSNTMTRVVAPTNMMKAAAESLGLRWQDLYKVHGRSLAEILKGIEIASHRNVGSENQVADAVGRHGIRSERLYEALKNHQSILTTLTGTTLGYKTILQSVTAENYPEVIRNQQLIANGAKDLNEAWKTASQSAIVQFDMMREHVRNLGIQVGTALIPMAIQAMHALTGLADVLASFAHNHATVVTVILAASAAMFAFGIALKATLSIVSLYTQGWQLLRRVLEITGIIDGARNSTEALSAAQSRGAAQADLQAAAQGRLATQQRLAAASAAGDVAEYNRLSAMLNNLEATELRVADSSARQAVAQADLGQSTRANVVAVEELQSAQARYGAVQQETTALQTRMASEMWATSAAADRQRQAFVTMGAANNEVKSSMAALNAEYVRLNAVTADQRLQVQQNTLAGQRYDDAVMAQITAIDDLSKANLELKASQAQTSVTTAEATAATQRLTAAELELRGAEATSAVAAAEVVTANEAVVVADTEATASTGLLTAALDALGITEGVVTAATGLLEGALAILLSPVVLVVAAIAGLVIGLKLLYDHCQPVHDAINALAHLLGDFFYAVGQKVMFILTHMGDVFGWIGQKVQELTGSSNGFTGALMLMQPELIPIIEGLQHMSDIAQNLSTIISKTGDALGKLGNLADRFLPGWKSVKDTTQAVGNEMAKVGSKMDDAGRHHDQLRHKINLVSDAEMDMRHKLGESMDAPNKQVAAAAKAYADSQKQIADAVNAMKGIVSSAYGNLASQQSHYAVDVANKWIREMARARMGVVAQIRAIQNVAAIPIKLAPIAPPDMSGLNKTYTASKGQDTAGSFKDMAQFTKHMDDLRGEMAKFGPNFKAASDSLLSGYDQKVRAAHADYISKLTAENKRHAQALTTLQATERQQLHAEYLRAEQARRSEDSSYLGRLKQIQDDHAQKVAQYLQMQTVASQNSASTFQAAMAEFDNRLNQINQTHTDAIRNLNETFHQKLAAAHGKYAANTRQAIADWYHREIGAINQRYGGEKRNIEWHIQHLAEAFRNHNQQQIAAMQNWLAQSSQNMKQHVAGVNEAHRRHVDQINATHNRHVAGIKNAHENHVNRENQVHQRHVDALTRIFHEHMQSIQKSMKALDTPGGLWDKLQAAANNLADSAMKNLATKILEHQKVTTADIKAVVDAQAGTKAMAAAMKKAGELVVAMGGSAGKAKNSLDLIASKINTDYKKAMDDVTRDLIAGHQPSAAHLAALQKAVNAQNKLTAAQQKAQLLAEADGAKHKKTADEWVKALSDAKNAVDTKFNRAIAEWVLSTNRSGLALAKFENQAYLAAQKQAQISQREADIQARVQARMAGLPAAIGSASAAFEQLKNTASTKLNLALNAAALEFAKTGKISDATAASLRQMQADSDKYDNALKAAQAAAQSVATTFDDLSKNADDKFKAAMDAYTLALYKASQGDQQATASLAGLRSAAVAAQVSVNGMAAISKKAADEINALANANNHDFNATLQAAQAKFEDAKAALADAIAHTASAEAVSRLRQQADAAAIELQHLKDAMTQAEQDISDDTGISQGGGTTTPYQQFEEGMQDQKLALAEQKQQFTESLDTQKQSLAQQKLSDQEAQTAFNDQLKLQKTTNDQLKQANATLQAQYQATLQALAMDNKLLYLSRLGLSRVLVGSGNQTSWLNNLGGQSFANTSAT